MDELRKHLNTLSRKDLQALAKDAGVRANKKNSEIVEDLVQHKLQSACRPTSQPAAILEKALEVEEASLPNKENEQTGGNQSARRPIPKFPVPEELQPLHLFSKQPQPLTPKSEKKSDGRVFLETAEVHGSARKHESHFSVLEATRMLQKSLTLTELTREASHPRPLSSALFPTTAGSVPTFPPLPACTGLVPISSFAASPMRKREEIRREVVGLSPHKTGSRQPGSGGTPYQSPLRTPARRVAISFDKEEDTRLDKLVISELSKSCTGSLEDVSGSAKRDLSRLAARAAADRKSSSVLLFGASGVGKTKLARAFASELKPNRYIELDFKALVASERAASADKLLRATFRVARKSSSAVILIENLQLVTQPNTASRKLKTELLVQFDELQMSADKTVNVWVVACTNAPLPEDENLVRCFNNKVWVPLPDADTREEVIFNAMAPRDAALGVKHVEHLVKLSVGYTIDELVRLCDAAVFEAQKQAVAAGQRSAAICMEHFTAAFLRVRPSLSEEDARAWRDWQTSIWTN